MAEKKPGAAASEAVADARERLSEAVSARGPKAIEWHYVRGHVGTPGNERVDAIADGLARGETVELYAGPLLGYEIPLFDLPDDTSVPARTNRFAAGGAKAAPYSYLSLVDGELMRHTTWADCERRVKGRSGARFKKAMSEADETAIRRGWNV